MITTGLRGRSIVPAAAGLLFGYLPSWRPGSRS